MSSTLLQQKPEKNKVTTTENNEHENSTNGTSTPDVASLVSAFNQSYGVVGTGTQSGRLPSVSNSQPIVPNLIKIYSDAKTIKPQPNDNQSPGKNDELSKIFQQIINESQNEQQQSPPPAPPLPPPPPQQQQQQKEQIVSSSSKLEPSHGYEEVYEEFTWDNLVHG